MKLINVICFSLGLCVALNLSGLRKYIRMKKVCKREKLSYTQYLQKYDRSNLLLRIIKNGMLFKVFLNTVYAHSYVYIRCFLILLCLLIVTLIIVGEIMGYTEIFNV